LPPPPRLRLLLPRRLPPPLPPISGIERVEVIDAAETGRDTDEVEAAAAAIDVVFCPLL
jgi:hypothetical protein